MSTFQESLVYMQKQESLSEETIQTGRSTQLLDP